MMSRVVYEVRLDISPKIRTEFLAWLRGHIAEMLSFNGFIDARILLGDTTVPNDISVQYTLQDRESFARYEAEHAQRMRAEGLERFPEGLSATRRLWDIQTATDTTGI